MWENRMITNSFLQNSMLHELYDNHPGIPCMRTLAISYAWWRPIDLLLEQKVKICNSCINESTKTPICPWKNQLALQIMLHLDFAGPFMRRMFLIPCGSYSDWIDFFQKPKFLRN